MPTAKAGLSRRGLVQSAPVLLAGALSAQTPAPGTRAPIIIPPAPVPLRKQKLLKSISTPKQSGHGAIVLRNQRAKVINTRGVPVGDLLAFAQYSAEEFIAPAFTIICSRTLP